MKNLSITPVDNSKAEDGTWTSYHKVQLKIARAGNKEFKRIFAQLTRPHKRDMEKNRVDEDIMKSIICETLAKSILVDWKDFVIDKKPLKYSIDNATSLLNNDVDCREFVQEFSRDLDNFLKEELEELVEK